MPVPKKGFMRQRKPNRLKDYDYSKTGLYFITICTKGRQEYFGNISNGIMQLSEIGTVVEEDWRDIPLHFDNVEIDEFVIMPNHIHGIIAINNGKEEQASLFPTLEPQYRLLPIVIGGYKSGVTRKVNAMQDNTFFQWQKSYYDHIIRNDHSLSRIRNYIANNPVKWNEDTENIISTNKQDQDKYYKTLLK